MLDGKVDLIHVSAGHHESLYATMITHPSMFLKDGCNVNFAAEVKKHVKTPVATVGALVEPGMMEEIIASGKADVVEIARALLADPDFPLKARLGMEAEIDTCMRCFSCLASSTRTRRRACAINPEIGYEMEAKCDMLRREEEKGTRGGRGDRGMEAALTAAKRGHEVILCEKTEKLGGALNCERNVPFKARLGEYLDRQARRLYGAGVDVRLNTEATKSLAGEIAPDVIVAALGARPLRLPIPGIDGDNVFGAEEVYESPYLAGDRVVILGGGLVGTELAIYLAGMGRSVTIMEMLSSLNDGGNMVHADALAIQIERLKIRLALGTKAVSIGEAGVTGENEGCSGLYESDTVVYAFGQRPLWTKRRRCASARPEFYQIGDCQTPKNILQATTAAYQTALDIGRL